MFRATIFILVMLFFQHMHNQEHANRPALDEQLLSAIRSGDSEACRLLLIQGANPNATIVEEGEETPLVFYVHPRSAVIYRWMLLAGLDPKTKSGDTAIVDSIAQSNMMGGNLPSDEDIIIALRLFVSAGARLSDPNDLKAKPVVRAEYRRLYRINSP